MLNEEKNPQTSFRIPSTLLKEFKILCVQRDTSQTAVVVAAIEQFVRGSMPVPVDKMPSASPMAGHAGRGPGFR
jgi:hypothetical protein